MILHIKLYFVSADIMLHITYLWCEIMCIAMFSLITAIFCISYNHSYLWCEIKKNCLILLTVLTYGDGLYKYGCTPNPMK